MLFLLIAMILGRGLTWQISRNSNSFKLSFASRTRLLSLQPQMSTVTTPAKIDESDSNINIADYELPTNSNNHNLLCTRHSTAHVMAMAVQKLFPQAKTAIGPWTDNGFFYDFFSEGKQISENDLKAIKKEMDSIIKANLPIIREEVSREEARERIQQQNEPFKLEILDGIKTEPITIYHIGDKWWDLCAGPHVESTGKLDARGYELESIAGAYWKGDEKNGVLQRIAGTAWENNMQLKVHKKRAQEAKLRDHRVVGQKLNLFSIQEAAGGGLVFWHPKGSIIRRQIEDYWKDEHVKNGYELLYTPHMANLDLWKTSGHFDFYRNDMFKPITVEDEEYQVKPMNCPFHCLVFKDLPRSYRELPIRWAELGTVYRYERSGTLHGLFRVRGFTQDDAHIFCLPSQLEDEIIGVLNLVQKVLNKFGFKKFEVMLSTKPDDHVGSDEIWDRATQALIGALEKKSWKYTVDEGGGAFYGPKIDIKIQDAIGRRWQCSTIQCDFNLPERFELEYTSSEGTKERPIMVHRAIFGSMERFFGILVENSAGDFPLWLSPVHLRLLPIVNDVLDYCKEMKQKAEQLGLRVEIDSSGDRIAKMIRNSEKEKIPVTAVIGLKEKDTNDIAIRLRKIGEANSLPLDELLNSLQHAIQNNLELNQVPTFVPKPPSEKSGATSDDDE